MTRANPHRGAGIDQAPDNAPADEPGATENRNAFTRLSL
jgi:hypothetical protein